MGMPRTGYSIFHGDIVMMSTTTKSDAMVIL